jgi:hypothetical protein
MSVAIYKGEKNMTDLVGRLFRVQGKGSQAAVKQASDLLLQANPDLKDLSKVPIGAVITVPDTGPAIHPAERATALTLKLSAVVTQAQRSLDMVDQNLTDVDTRAVTEAKSFLEVLKSKDLQETASASPDLKRGLAEIVDTAQAMLKDLQADPKARKVEIAALRNNLTSFIGQ